MNSGAQKFKALKPFIDFSDPSLFSDVFDSLRAERARQQRFGLEILEAFEDSFASFVMDPAQFEIATRNFWDDAA